MASSRLRSSAIRRGAGRDKDGLIVNEAASQVLLERTQVPPGLGRMAALSLAVHVGVVLMVALIPAGWLGQQPAQEPRTIMTISLGGAPGPGEGGMTPLGGRPIQQVLPLAEAQKPQAVRVPAEKAPAMTVPTPEARRRETKQPDVEQAPPDARGQTPTKGADVRAGSAPADTGASGIGLGLSAGGGGTGTSLDVGDFCCPEYIATMMELIRRRWDPNQRVPGEVMIKYTIVRSGEITGVEVERSSGQTFLDLSAQRALALTRQLPPLPSAFTEDHLTVHLNFQYRR